MIKASDLIDFSSDPAFSLDAKMRVSGWNAAAEELLGYNGEETFGQPCSTVLQAYYPTGEPLCSVICEGRACLSGGEKWGIGNCLIRHKNGEMVNTGISSLVLPPEARVENSNEPVAIIFLRKNVDTHSFPSQDIPMRVFSLGTFGLAIAGSGLDVDSWKRKQAVVVLKCLISQLDRPVHRERLIEWIWPNSDPEKGWSRLKVTISYLRGALRKRGVNGDIIETIGQSYIVRRSSVWIDSEVFSKLVSEGWGFLKTDDFERAQVKFEEAESLYRGDYFEDEPYANWCAVERERLREVYLELLSGLAKCHTQTGQFMAASRVCRQALSSDPCRENFIQTLMECLVALNRPDWARAHFISWRRSLDQEYGLKPTAETLKVYHQIIGDEKTDLRKSA